MACDPFGHGAAYVKLVDCRNTLHVTLLDYLPPAESRIERVNEAMYYVRSADELRYYRAGATATKSDNVRSVKRAFDNLKKLINCNYDAPDNVRFVTLTYADNMQDNGRVSGDWRAFERRLRARYGRHRYVYVKEKQGRGAWHVHALLFFDGPAPFMENGEVRALWGHGFVQVEAVRDDANNLGQYLCAYLTDDKETGKKGARLLNYEAGVRLYNCSRDVRRPVARVIGYREYMEIMATQEMFSETDCEVHIQTGRKLHVRYQIFHSA